MIFYLRSFRHVRKQRSKWLWTIEITFRIYLAHVRSLDVLIWHEKKNKDMWDLLLGNFPISKVNIGLRMYFNTIARIESPEISGDEFMLCQLSWRKQQDKPDQWPATPIICKKGACIIAIPFLNSTKSLRWKSTLHIKIYILLEILWYNYMLNIDFMKNYWN